MSIFVCRPQGFFCTLAVVSVPWIAPADWICKSKTVCMEGELVLLRKRSGDLVYTSKLEGVSSVLQPATLFGVCVPQHGFGPRGLAAS